MTGAEKIELGTAEKPEIIPIPREERVRQILDETGAIITNGHFIYASGLHGNTYINKDAIYPHTNETRELCSMWAEDLKDGNIDTVVGPAIGGVILSHATASALMQMTGRNIAGVYAEKKEYPEKGFKFTRGYENYIQSKRVLIVDDILTTGGSAMKIIDLIRECGGEIVAVATIVNRGGVTPETLNIERLNSLINLEINTFDPGPATCDGCRDKIPIDQKLGQGKNLTPGQSTTIFSS